MRLVWGLRESRGLFITLSLDRPACAPSIGEWTAYRSTEQIWTHQTRLTKPFSDCASSDLTSSLSCWISLYHWVSFHFLARKLDLASVPKSHEKLTVGMCTSSGPGLSSSKEQLHKLPSLCSEARITRISGSLGTAQISTISWPLTSLLKEVWLPKAIPRASSSFDMASFPSQEQSSLSYSFLQCLGILYFLSSCIANTSVVIPAFICS